MSCSFSNDSVNNSKQKVIVGISPDLPPKVFMKNGTVKGYVIDLLDALSDVTALEFELREMSFPSLITSVSYGLIDIATCLVVTEERKKNIDFSEVYDWGAGFIIVSHDDHCFKDLESLKGGSASVELGTVTEKFVDDKNLEMSLNLSISRYDSLSLVVESVKSGRVDAAIINYENSLAATNNHLIFSMLGGENKFAFGFRKDRGDDLLEKINTGIRFLKDNSEFPGEECHRLYKIRNRWSK